MTFWGTLKMTNGRTNQFNQLARESQTRNTIKIVVPPESHDRYATEVDDSQLARIRPWRIALAVKHMQVKIIVDLMDSCSIGRLDEVGDVIPDIDLSPFAAEAMGVSRQHLFLKLQGDGVFVMDNQ